MSKINKLSDVVDWRLCLGCGACAYICPDQKVSLFDYFEEGIRPVVANSDCAGCRQCLDVCPGVRSVFDSDPPGKPVDPAFAGSFEKEWGPVVAMWEGHATDEEIRFKGSSGGALTAIAAYCMEQEGMSGTLHIAQDPDDPIRNRTRLSRSRGDLLAATGSRYSPASVCNGLGLVESAESPCVVIGKPSEIAALVNARRMRPELDRKIGVTLSFFCAESPSTKGTKVLINKMGADERKVQDLRYRGFGWPGYFAPTLKGANAPVGRMTYSESWAFLQAFRPWSVQLWPDGSGELADISCGDPWYEKPDGQNPGFSLVVARTERGRAIVEGAMKAGYLNLTRAEAWKLPKSQSGLLEKKGVIWGRRKAARLLGLPVTRLDGLNLKHCWNLLSVKARVRALFGTMRRIVTRGLRKPLRLSLANRVPVRVPRNPA